MKLQEKLAYIQENHFGEWLKKRKEVEDKVSKEHYIWCVCGKLCTGLHEMNCKRFNDKVTSQTVQSLKHLYLNKYRHYTDNK